MLRRWCWAVAICGIAGQFSIAEEPAKRPDWDQKKAVQKVKEVLAVEEKGELPWDKIAWLDDAKAAVEKAKKEEKPLFVYFFLKKNVGPMNAPC
jgi:hypothetical protein